MEVFDFMPYTYYTRMTSVRREEIEAAPVVGWPLDSVILNAVKNLGAWRG